MSSDTNAEFADFDPLLFAFAFMPFIGYVLFWRACTRFRKSHILGSRGKTTEAVIIEKTEAGSRHLRWNRVTQFQFTLEYEALDECNQRTISVEKSMNNIHSDIYHRVCQGDTVNVRYDPINPFMMDIDDKAYLESTTNRARTACTSDCCSTLLHLTVAVFFVLIPYWTLKAAGIAWYWLLVIVALIPMVFTVLACVCCCACCMNHDMIAWYKTRNILQEQRRREIAANSKCRNHDSHYRLMDASLE